MNKKNDFVSKIIELSNNDDEEKAAAMIEERLKEEPNNIELWLRLALLELYPPIADYEKSIESCEKVLDFEKNNVIAILLIAYIKDRLLGGIDEKLKNKLCFLTTDSAELNSMLRYVASWYYAASWYYERKEDPNMKEQLLKESINLYKGHVWNYVCLAVLYFSKGRDLEAKELVKMALKNVQKVYRIDNDDNLEYDATDSNEFLNERINGIHITSGNLERIKDMLDK